MVSVFTTIDTLLKSKETIGDAQSFLRAIGLSRPLHDSLSAHRALCALSSDHDAIAISEAWRAAFLFPARAEAHALAAHTLLQAGEAALGLSRLSRAVELEPTVLQYWRSLISGLTTYAPAAAPARTKQALAYVRAKDAPPFAACAEKMGLTLIGSCSALEGSVVGWISRKRSQEQVELEVLWWDGDHWEREAIFPYLDGEPVKERELSLFQLPWRASAIGALIRDKNTEEILPGAPLFKTPAPVAGGRTRRQRGAGATPSMAPAGVTLVIAAYEGARETEECLQSILSARNECRFKSILIDDASPNVAVRRSLNCFAENENVVLLRNEYNLGFTASVNRALALADPQTDVILLNSDTLVNGDWIDRLRRAAYSAADIGTVTPFTNAGEIISFPRPREQNPMLSAEELARTDAAAARVNDSVRVDLPVGVGFCLYMRRDCLDAVGFLDAARFNRGYGEESDFCMRALNLGWRSVCATDVFVAHVGSVSFGQEKSRLVGANMSKVGIKYSNYRPLLDRFVKEDPLRRPRRRLERALLGASTSPAVLAVGPADWRTSEMVRRFRHQQAASARRLLWLSVDGGQSALTVRIESEAPDAPASLSYRLPQDHDLLRQDLKQMGVKEVHWHIIPTSDQLTEFVDNLGLETHIWFSHVSMVDYACRISQNTPQFKASIFQGARSVTTGGAFAKALTAKLPLEAERVEVRLADLTVSAPREPELITQVALVDCFNNALGFEKILSFVRAVARDDLPAYFHVLGSTLDDLALARTGKATVLDEVSSHDRRALGAAIGCHMAISFDETADPLGLGVELAAQAAPAIAYFAGGARDERAAAHPRAQVLDKNCSMYELAIALFG